MRTMQGRHAATAKFTRAYAALFLLATLCFVFFLTGCSETPEEDTPVSGIVFETPVAASEEEPLPLAPGVEDGVYELEEGEEALAGITPAPPLWTLAFADGRVAEITSYDFNALPRTSAEIEGAAYSGVLLMDVLTFNGLAPGSSYTISSATQTVTLEAGEILSPSTLLADMKNAAVIEAPEGPLLLVVGDHFDHWLPAVTEIAPAADSIK